MQRIGRKFFIGAVGFRIRGATMMEPLIVIALALLLVIAACTDLVSSRIPNWLTFPAMGGALVSHAWLGGIPEVFVSLAGLAVGCGLFVIPYAFGGIGAGDVKLMAAIGAMIGPYDAFLSGLLAVMVGGAYGLGAMWYQWGFVATGRKIVSAAQSALLAGGLGWMQEFMLPFRLRYGLAIVGGTLLFVIGIHPFGE
jgi:prepilin peptidase CpaA